MYVAVIILLTARSYSFITYLVWFLLYIYFAFVAKKYEIVKGDHMRPLA